MNDKVYWCKDDPAHAAMLAVQSIHQSSGNDAVIAFNKPDRRIRFWAWVLGHKGSVSHTSFLNWDKDRTAILEHELTHDGRVTYYGITVDELTDIEGVYVLPHNLIAKLYEVYLNNILHTLPHHLRITWRSLLRSGVEYTLPPWSAWLGRAILRVFGDDPLPVTCSGYVYYLLTGSSEPDDRLLPPHLLIPALHAVTNDLPNRN